MAVKKQKYRRLQVVNIKLRTFFEIVALIAAIIVCCSAVIRSYEDSYAHATTDTAEASAMQLAHNISGIADPVLLATDNVTRREFVMENYSQQLENCFIGEDVQYSGGIFAVNEGEIQLFAKNGAYGTLYEATGASDEFSEALLLAVAGEKTSINSGDTYIAFYPVIDEETGIVCAVSSAAVDYRASTEFDSPVKNRIVLISLVSSGLILLYFTISAARSEKKKLNGEAV